jgi:hypothetical protein
MEEMKLNLDDGVIRLNVNENGVLCFNPSDFNLYNRFLDLVQELPEIEKRYLQAHGEQADDADEFSEVRRELCRADEIDSEVKKRLGEVFGGADFDKLLGGVNCMACGSNGELVITNLLNALKPYLENGVKQHAQKVAKKAKLDRDRKRSALNTPGVQ